MDSGEVNDLNAGAGSPVRVPSYNSGAGPKPQLSRVYSNPADFVAPSAPKVAKEECEVRQVEDLVEVGGGRVYFTLPRVLC